MGNRGVILVRVYSTPHNAGTELKCTHPSASAYLGAQLIVRMSRGCRPVDKVVSPGTTRIRTHGCLGRENLYLDPMDHLHLRLKYLRVRSVKTSVKCLWEGIERVGG